jgi:hypothetical protein
MGRVAIAIGKRENFWFLTCNMTCQNLVCSFKIGKIAPLVFVVCHNYFLLLMV